MLSCETAGYEDYCLKEERAGLKDEYTDVKINMKNMKLLEHYEEDEGLKRVYKNPLSWQRLLIQEISESKKSRHINWIIDTVGKSGKSQLSKLFDIKPEYKVLTLGVDYAQAFNYWAACEIDDYIRENCYAPNAIVIDATKDLARGNTVCTGLCLVSGTCEIITVCCSTVKILPFRDRIYVGAKIVSKGCMTFRNACAGEGY